MGWIDEVGISDVEMLTQIIDMQAGEGVSLLNVSKNALYPGNTI